MTEDQLLFAMARYMVASNQGDFEKPAAQWTETELAAEGFYADAKTCLAAIKASGFTISEKKVPPKEEVIALAEAITLTFPTYRRVSAAQAATEILEHLSTMKMKLSKIIGLKYTA